MVPPKRKASGAFSGATGTPKKHKPSESPTPEELKQFYESTLKLVFDLRDESTDEQVAFPFVKVPSKKLYPDYYEIISHPIALHDILKKINKGKYSEYATIDEYVDDFQLLLDNAAKYNDPESWIVTGAQQIYDFVVKQKTVFLDRIASEHASAAAKSSETHHKLKLKLKEPAEDKSGVTFARLPQICSELLQDVITHDFPDEGIISSPFMEEVDLDEYPDYINYVEKPMAFNTVVTQLGRKKMFSPKNSVLENIQKFSDMTTLIFANAQAYNDPSSEIYQDSVKLQNLFNEKIDVLKSQIEDLKSAKLKLKLSKPKLKLSLGAPEEPHVPKKRGRKKKVVVQEEIKQEEEQDVDTRDSLVDDNDDSRDLIDDQEFKSGVLAAEKFTPNTLGKSAPTIPVTDTAIQETSISSSITVVSQTSQYAYQKVQQTNIPLQRHQDLKKALFPTHHVVPLTSLFDYRVPSNGFSTQAYTITLPPEVLPLVTFKATLHSILYEIKSGDMIDGHTYLNLGSEEDFQCKLFVNDEEVSTAGDCFEEKGPDDTDLLAVLFDLKLNYGLNCLSFECKVAPSLSKRMRSSLKQDEGEETSGRHTRHQLQQLKMTWDVETINFYVICNSS